MIRFPLHRALCILAMSAAAPVMAATAHVQRVVLLPATDRSSVVFELSAEPRNVSTRRISDSVVELDAGPFAGPGGAESLQPRLLKAPANVRFVDLVSVRLLPTPAGLIVRARITLSSMAQAVVRSSGRRVYVDVSPMPTEGNSRSPAPPAVQATAARPSGPVAAATVAPDQAFKAAVREPLEKLKELSPFLTSAATSSDPAVMSALLPAVLTARTALAAQQPPDGARGSHTMVLGAVDRIIRALDPAFTGDRAAAIRQSVTTIDVVGGVLVGE
jgi:hypothetical protein